VREPNLHLDRPDENDVASILGRTGSSRIGLLAKAAARHETSRLETRRHLCRCLITC
jgi:hypothetical protein